MNGRTNEWAPKGTREWMTDSTEAKAQEESTARVTWLPAARLLGNALPSLVFLPSFHFIDSINIDFHRFWAIRLMRSRNGLERLLPNCQIDSLFFLTFRRRRYWVFTEFSGEHLIHWLPPPFNGIDTLESLPGFYRVSMGVERVWNGCGTGGRGPQTGGPPKGGGVEGVRWQIVRPTSSIASTLALERQQGPIGNKIEMEEREKQRKQKWGWKERETETNDRRRVRTQSNGPDRPVKRPRNWPPSSTIQR